MSENTRKPSRAQYYELENILKGAANHWRIEILEVLRKHPSISTDDIVEIINVNYQTGAAHVRRLVRAGLVSAYRQGKITAHDLTPRGKNIISFLKKL